MKFAAISLVSLAALAAAAPVPALVCPAGTTAGSQVNSRTFDATVAEVDAIIGRFQVSDWQGLTQVGQSGPDNTPGSTRDVAFGPFVLREQLLSFKKSTQHERQQFQYIGEPVAVSPNYSITNYQEDLRLSVVKADPKAPQSQIVWSVALCLTSSNPSDVAEAEGLFSGAHEGGFNNIEAALA